MLTAILSTKSVSGYELKADGKLQDMDVLRQKLVDDLVHHISTRFSGTSEDWLKSTIISSFRNWPLHKDEDDFGVTEVDVLCKKFQKSLEKQGVDEVEGIPECQLLKKLVYKRFEQKISDVTWESVNSTFQENGVKNVLQLIDLIRSLPPTSVINETSFNQMKLVKTDRRHRLSQRHLNDIMVIRLQSAPVEQFDPTAAINRWMVSPTVKNRKFNYQRLRKNRKVLPDVDSEVDFEDQIESETETELEVEKENENERETVDTHTSVDSEEVDVKSEGETESEMDSLSDCECE